MYNKLVNVNINLHKSENIKINFYTLFLFIYFN